MTFSVTANMVNLPLSHRLEKPGNASGAGSGFDALVDQFKELASRSPFDQARDEVLRRHGLNEESAAKLSDAERAAIDSEIADYVKHKLGLADQRPPVDPTILQGTAPTGVSDTRSTEATLRIKR